jgi:pyruvate dehydrogenase E2 component (dihydrolipoamide acetyltransferase)
MPGVSADSDEAVLQGWLVSVGQEIHEGDAIATVETEKATVDIESDQEAVVGALVAEAGAVVPVGSPIAVLLEIGEDRAAAEELLAQLSGGSAPAAAGGNGAGPDARGFTDLDHPQDAIPPELDAEGKEPGALPSPVAAKTGTSAAATAPEREAGRIFASPIARRMAQEAGIDLEEIEGSGPNGRILRRDVERARDERGAAAVPAAVPAPEPAAAEPAPAAPAKRPAPVAPAGTDGAGFTEIPHSRFRKAVAGRLQASKQTAPHFYLRATVRVDALIDLRRQLVAAGTRVSLNDFFVKAAAKALADVPAMNVSWSDEAVRQFESVDVGVAIASEKGLITPVVRAADSLSLSALSARIKDFAARAGEGGLRQHELEGGTLTVTNLGMYGVDEFAAIINPPQSAILAVGAVSRQPVVGADDALEAGSVVTVTLSVDHRPVDGVLGATWLKRLRELLEDPLLILA